LKAAGLAVAALARLREVPQRKKSQEQRWRSLLPPKATGA
jgi:hypothetical protein